MFFVRLYRLIPMMAVLCITALIIYFTASMRSTKPQAKRAVLKFFTWSFIVLSAVFLLATLYAVLEDNAKVTELMGSFLIFTLFNLGITQICYAVFIHHYPNFALKAQPARTLHWYDKVADWFRRAKNPDRACDEVVDATGEDTTPR